MRARAAQPALRAMLAALAGALALAASPASASAATVTTQAASRIATDSATLNGQASNFSSGDYCSFIYWHSGQPSSWNQAYQAVPCASSYSIGQPGFAPFSPGQTYSYAAIHCAAYGVVQGFGYECKPSSGSGSSPWDTIDPCYPSNPGSCPSFTTESSGGTLSTSAASNVGFTQVVLNATSSGYTPATLGSNGSGDYCAFIYWTGREKSSEGLVTPAVPCITPSSSHPGTYSNTYSVQLTGLTPGESYAYAAIHCAAVGGQPGGPYYCNTDGSYADTNPWDTIDPCFTNSNSNCQPFTTGTPSGQTGAATDVFGTSATLNGQITVEDENPQNISWWFEYTTDPSFGAYAQTPASTLSCTPQNGVCSVSANVSGLQPGTPYYYRIVVSTADAASPQPYNGNTVSFTTGGRAITDPATSVAAASATLNGELAPGDGSLSYNWVYSTSDQENNGLLQGASACGSAACGTVQAGQDQLVSTGVSGLKPGTSYYFQLQTSNPSIHGSVLSFTTAGASCPAAATLVNQAQIPDTTFVVTGCFASSSGQWTGYGPVTINGLSLPGPSNQTVTITTSSAGAGTLTVSSGYSLSIARLLLLTASGAISLHYANSAGDSVLTVIPDPSASLFGFPMLSPVTVTALPPSDQSNPGGASISIAVLGMPTLFGGITAQGSATVDAQGALSKIDVQLGESTLGPLQLPSFTFSYDQPSNTWYGDAELYFPLAPVGIGATVEVQNDRLTSIQASYQGPGIPIGEGLEISGLSASAGSNPFSFGGSVSIGFGPQIAKTSLFTGTVGFDAAFNQDQTITGLSDLGIPEGTVLHDVPFTLGVSGNLQLLGFITLAQAQADYYALPSSIGQPLITASFQLPQSLELQCPSALGSGTFGFVPKFTIAGDASGNDFNLYGEGGVSIDLCGLGSTGVNGQGAISSRGFAVCVGINVPGLYDNVLGVGGMWPSSLPTSFSGFFSDLTFYPESCDITPYEASVIAASARMARSGGARAAGVGTIRLPGGLPFAVIRVKGRGGPPLLSLHGPRALALAMRVGHAFLDVHGRYLVIADPANDTTYIELTHPASGGYRLAVQPGSPPITSVAVAHGLPAPSVHATVRGRGAVRTLTWRARAITGQRLVFRELGGGGDRLLASTARANGTLRYRLRPGLRARRFLIVQVFNHGMLQKVIRLAAYTGPVSAAPRRPTHLQAVRFGATLTVTWKDSGASRYLVLVAYPNRATRLYTTRSRRLVLRGVPPAGTITVTVTGVNALDQRGPSVSAIAAKPQQHHKRRHRG